MTNPLVSVIIPCYNVEKYVLKAIESITNQTYKNLEIIIVDDASTDKTLDLIKTIKDSRIRLIELKENTKKIGAVSYAIENAKGDYIAFQDSDDYSSIHRIENQVKILIKDDSVGICFTNYAIKNPGGEILSEKKNVRLSDSDIRREFELFGKDSNSLNFKPTQCATMLVKTSIIKKLGGYHSYFSGKVGEDIYLVFQILKRTKATSTDNILYTIIRSENSLTTAQFQGLNPKSAYSWELISMIIDYDIKGMDVLQPENSELLRELELKACEEALVKEIRLKNSIIASYKQSRSFRVGKLVLLPFATLIKIVNYFNSFTSIRSNFNHNENSNHHSSQR